MSGPPAPDRRSRRPQHLIVGATTAVVMATTGAVILPPDTSVAQYSPRDDAAASPPRSDTMTYSRGGSTTISRDADRVPRAKRAKARAEHQRAKQERAQQQRAQRRRAAARARARRWVLPITDYSLSARFGEISWLWSSYHTGLDFSASYGTAIRAVAAGTVTEASYDGSYGYKTVVTLPNGTELWYCHQTSLMVGVGATVDPGEVIGYVGTTGNVTGAHLHLEVRPSGQDPVDPFAALEQHGLEP